MLGYNNKGDDNMNEYCMIETASDNKEEIKEKVEKAEKAIKETAKKVL